MMHPHNGSKFLLRTFRSGLKHVFDLLFLFLVELFFHYPLVRVITTVAIILILKNDYAPRWSRYTMFGGNLFYLTVPRSL